MFLTDNLEKIICTKKGLFYTYRSDEELEEIVELFRDLSKVDIMYVYHEDLDELIFKLKSCFRNVRAAGGLVMNNRGEYLLIYRRGKWDLPKGKQEQSETDEQTALREVEEECGIKDLRIEKPLISTYHTYDHRIKFSLKRTKWYLMKYEGTAPPVPQTVEDIEKIHWVKKQDLPIYLNESFAAIQDVFEYCGVGKV